MIYSFSRLDLYSRCPWRWRQKYILNRDEEITKPLALGKAVHKAIEVWLKGIEFNDAVIEGMIEAEFHPEVSKNEIEFLLSRAKKIEGETEVHFELPLSSSIDAPRLQGYIDVVQEKGKFVDWKSNWVSYHPNDNMQMRLYAWALMEIKGWKMVDATLYFLRHKPIMQTYLKSDGEIAREWALNLIKEIKAKLFALELQPDAADEIFPAQAGRHCSHCPFAAECIEAFPTEAM